MGCRHLEVNGVTGGRVHADDGYVGMTVEPDR